MSAQSAIDAFNRNRDSFLQDLFTFLRYPTISAQSEHTEDLRRCAEWIRDQLTGAGFSVEIIPTAGHPVVFADSGPSASGAPTILFYGHYDVQPIGDPKLWTSPAFEPTIRDGVIYARGSADDKGQVMTHLAAVRSWHAGQQDWPVRIKFLIEGEEEIGSPHLPEFVERYRDRLACDYVVLSDTGKFDEQTPSLAYSSRGLVYKQITIDGPRKDLHSGLFGGTIANPANVLAKIIASLHDDRLRVTIPGFYDDVQPLSPEERERLAKHSLGDKEWLAGTGSPAAVGEEGYTTTERRGARPTLDVNGLLSGYTGEGSATIIPSRAMAKVSMRLVANQDPAKISQAFDDAVRQACPTTVKLRIDNFASCAAYVAPVDSPGMQAAARALQAGYGRPPVYLREGGTLPILPMFKKTLGADSLMMGFAAPDSNLHSPNEFFHVSDFERGTKCILHLLAEMGQIKT